MLRYDYMPSDFHPLFLFLGERPDLAALARLLRRFAENPMPTAVAERIPGATSRDALVLTPADDDFGMRDLGGRFAWKLTAWQAEQIAERIETLSAERHQIRLGNPRARQRGRNPGQGVARRVHRRLSRYPPITREIRG